MNSIEIAQVINPTTTTQPKDREFGYELYWINPTTTTQPKNRGFGYELYLNCYQSNHHNLTKK